MKYLILAILFTTSLHATTIGQYISSPDGSSVQAFNVSARKIVYEKHSNFFDNKKDLTLGDFEMVGESALKEERAKLAEILAKVKTVDEYLRKKDSSFNDLSSKKPHEPFLVLDSYRITKDSDLYPELKKIYDTLAARKWKHVSGIKLSDDLKNVIKIENGKEVSKENFNLAFHCKKQEVPTVCGYKDLGILFVQ